MGLLKSHLKNNHGNMTYEKKLLKGKTLLDFMNKEQIPWDIMPAEDKKLIMLYRRYIYQKVDTIADINVPLY